MDGQGYTHFAGCTWGDVIMRRLSTFFFLVVTVGFASAAYAHRDTIFHISESGELVGVPEEFSPAYLLIDHESDVVNSVTLQVSGHIAELPACIARFFDLPIGEEILVSGSWYHERSLLPPYISIRLPSIADSRGMFEGHSLLFSLETAGLIEVSRHELLPGDGGMRMETVAPESICSEPELAQLQPRGIE